LEQQSEAKGISPIFFEIDGKTNRDVPKICENEAKRSKTFKILQDRSKTNVFVSNCVEEKKRKNETSLFWGKKAKKNECNRSPTIEDLPLLHVTTLTATNFI
jgi:hypothetical protein